MKRLALIVSIASIAAAVTALAPRTAAQSAIPEIPFDAQPNFLKLPADIHMGEAAGVATNSKGQVFVYTRTGNPTAGLGNSRFITHGGARR